MERQLKERLVGASILVALIVIVVPELLSGPMRSSPPQAAGGTRRIEIDLNTRQATASVVPLESQAASAAEPAPAAADTTTSRAEPASASVAEPHPETSAGGAAEAAPRLESAAPAPISASRKVTESRAHAPWSVQVGSFANRANAERLVHQLKSSGASAYLLASGSGAHQRYRVRVGPLADRATAERTLSRLKALGHAATLVAPGAPG